MTAMTDVARAEAVATYRARRHELIDEALEDDRSRRPINAARKRRNARILAMAALSEEFDSQPTGLAR